MKLYFGEDAHDVCKLLTDAGHQAWFVGGCVRDALRGLEPKDVDIVTDARPDRIAAIFPGSDLIGASFGVVAVKHGESRFEVATFRSDGQYSDGRRPDSVRFGNIDDDAARRDFTVNSIYAGYNGELYDPNDGMKDLQYGILRCIGNPEERFEEDRLRMLRAVRFAVKFWLRIEPSTAESIHRNAHKISTVSKERVRDELLGILRPRSGLDVLHRSGLLEHVLPEVHALDGVPQDPVYHPEGDVLAHTKLVVDHIEDRSNDLLLVSALLHDVGKAVTTAFNEDGRITAYGHAGVGANMTRHILERLRFSSEFVHLAGYIVGRHMRFMDCDKWRKSTRRRILASPVIADELALHKADCLGSNGDLSTWEKVSAWLATAEITNEVALPEPLVNGHDLLAMGMKSGPPLGVILKVLMDLQLEGVISSKEDGVRILEQHKTDDAAELAAVLTDKFCHAAKASDE